MNKRPMPERYNLGPFTVDGRRYLGLDPLDDLRREMRGEVDFDVVVGGMPSAAPPAWGRALPRVEGTR